MSNLVRNGLILLFILLISLWAIIPPKDKLNKGKDLAGGASLVYEVDIRPGDGPEVLEKVRQVVKERLDPSGVMEISVVTQGRNRIEIAMPLPNDEVKALRAKFDEALKGLSSVTISSEEFERVAAGDAANRAAWINERVHDVAMKGRIEQAFRDYDALAAASKSLREAAAEVQTIKDRIRNAGTTDANDPIVTSMNAALAAAQAKETELVNSVAQASIVFDSSREQALTTGLSGAELRRALLLPDRPVRLPDQTKQMVTRDSPRAASLKAIEARYPDQKNQIAAAIDAWKTYELKRKSLDDPEDIVRILKGAGVLNFRIAVKPGEHPQEQELRNQLRQGGPSAVKADDARFYKINKLEGWAETIEDLDRMRESPATYFLARGLVAEDYKGQPYILLWDKRGLRLTEHDGNQWSLAKSLQGTDQLGRPAIDFQMDPIGANMLGELTEKNVGNQMAVLLDDEVYTAPRLNSRISNSGQITGSFTPTELEYIIRVLGAGSLQAKLSPEPISRTVLGPQLGAENLEKGFRAGVIAFIVVGIFMIGYYFSCGFISMLALLFNLILLLGAMALNHAAFTLPGIAGIILTFGQAVDANVLVYERMREEFNRGHDMRTAVRLGFSRALSAIVDGNVTTLIVCVVLGLFGTQEIKGFALTLGIGTVTTLIAQLFFTRFIFTVLVDKLGWRNASMLPMVGNNWLGKRLVPNIDWMKLRYFSYSISAVLMFMGLGFIFVQGKALLGTEFRGGTAVTLVLKEESRTPEGEVTRKKLDRGEVEDRVKRIGDNAPDGDQLNALQFAEVIAVNPESDGRHSSTFTIKTLITDPNLVQKVLAEQFKDELDSSKVLTFTGSDVAEAARSGRAFPITTNTLGPSIDRPSVTDNVSDFYGGLAIVLDNISPAVSRSEIETRLSAKRNQTDFADTAGRRTSVRVLDGSDAQARSLVLLVKDNDTGYFEDPREWERLVRDSEWRLVRAALTQQQTLAEVQSFSPAVAETFRQDAIWAMTFSTLLIIIYIWIRFNSIRYSLAAIATTLHDCICAVGFVALATWLFNNAPGLAGKLGILPFKIDLNVMAAIMTTLGYSLNDTIIVMDRIRENRGKLPYASRKVINDSINQTISRTIITAGTTVLAVMTLYIVGGEGIRVFSYTMLVGVFVGTFSSIAVAAPLVWSGKDTPESGPGTAGNEYTAGQGESRAAA